MTAATPGPAGQRPEPEALRAEPALAPLYLRALGSAARRRTAVHAQDTASASKPAVALNTVLALNDVAVERERLQAYQRVCGFRTSDVLPQTFGHLVGFGLSMERMTRPDFPFPLLGLVHIRNTIAQRRPLRVEERLRVEVWAEGPRPHRAGQEIDLCTELSSGGEVVWSEVSTYLRRTGKPPTSTRPAQDEAMPQASGVPVRISVPADIGRAYAAVSGDRNPIHLSNLSARLFGFRAAIAHGMWLAARSVAHYEGRLPGAVDLDFRFRSPLFLPGRVQLTSTPIADGWDVEVRNARSGRPHLSGTIRAYGG